jgi:hypothetical protein
MLTVATQAEMFTLTAPNLTSTNVMVNGVELRAEPDGSVGTLKAHEVKKGSIRLVPASVTFLTFPAAHNKNCM